MNSNHKTIVRVTFIFIVLLTMIIPRTLPFMTSRGEVNILYSILAYLYRGWLVIVLLYFVGEIGRNFRIKKSKLLYVFYIVVTLLFSLLNYYYWNSRSPLYTLLILSLPVLYYVLKSDESFLKLFKKYYNIIFLSLVVQLLLFRYEGKPVFGIGDPNYSGMISFFFFYLSIKLNKKIGIYFSFLTVLLFVSRTQILAIVIFFLIRSFPYVSKVIRSINFSRIYLVSLVVFFGIGSFLILHLSFNNSYSGHFDKLISLNDASNYLRFTENFKILTNIFVDKSQDFIYGYSTPEQFLEDGNEIFPHNDLLMLFVMIGLLGSIVYFGIILKEIKLYFNRNVAFCTSIILYSLLLGLFKDFYVMILFFMIIKMPYFESNSNRLANI